MLSLSWRTSKLYSSCILSSMVCQLYTYHFRWMPLLVVVHHLHVQIICVQSSKQLQPDGLMLSPTSYCTASWHAAAHNATQWPLCCSLCMMQPAHLPRSSVQGLRWLVIPCGKPGQ